MLQVNDIDNVRERLLDPFSPLKQLSFVFTEACNLRCVYCPQSVQPRKTVAPKWLIENIIRFVKEKKIPKVVMGFYGDTLCYKGWEKYADSLLEEGTDLNLCSNFNHTLSDNELETLSRFKEIQFSVDSVDSEIMREVRPPADIRTIIYNHSMIIGRSMRNGSIRPKIIWNCTLTDKAIPGLPDLIGTAAGLGVSKLVFNELVRFKEAKGGVKSIFELSKKDFYDALEKIEKTKEIASRDGLEVKFSFYCWDKMIELKKELEKVEGEQVGQKLTRISPIKGIQGHADFFAEKAVNTLGPGQTRLCPEPWSNVYLSAEGDVYACCVNGNPLGRVSPSRGISDVMQSDQYRDLRQQLLTGKITDPSCFNCPLLVAGDTASFAAFIAKQVKEHSWQPNAS